MHYLAIVSLIWAFSFGLIGHGLSGVNPFLIATIRLGLAGLLFLPFFKPSQIPPNSTIRLFFCGAVQFGVMYVCYIRAFQWIPSHLIALFSILTPLYVVLIHAFRQGRLKPRHLLATLLSIGGAAIIQAKTGDSGSVWIGFGWMQLSGIAFAFGQVDYRDWKRAHPRVKDSEIFALLYMGGFFTAIILSMVFGDWETIPFSYYQILLLGYLGIIASGVGFFLWNKGASLSKPETLAVFNNALVPLALFCSLFIFGEVSEITVNALLRLSLGGICLVGAVFIAEKSIRPA